MEIWILLALLASGIIVGFINTLAGGATVISMSVFMMCGLPMIVAAGTNRIAVLMQNLVSTIVFRKQKLINLKQALKFSIPIMIGTLVGSQFTVMITNELYSIFFMCGLIFIGIMLIAKPLSWKSKHNHETTKISLALWIMLFISGIYSGSVYVGVGYIFIAIFSIGFGFDLIRSNALKGFMALILTPISLIIFIAHGDINFKYGLIHGVGNIIGAYIGSKHAKTLGVKFIRKVLIIMIIISIIDLIRKHFL